MKRALAFLLGLLVALPSLAGPTRHRVATSNPVAFPLTASSNGRYLVDRVGRPFPILGRNAWSIIGLTAAEQQQVIANTVFRRFSSIEVWIPAHFAGSVNLPKDGANNLPFTKRLDGSAWSGTFSYSNIINEAPDFTQPNEPYWASVDALFAYCEQNNILVQVFFAYLGFDSTTEGWYPEMVANGPTKMQTYGAWVASRYKNQKNVVWMIGGDYCFGAHTCSGSVTAAEAGFIAGLKSVTTQSTLYAAEWVRGSDGSIATDQVDFGSNITLNSTYASSTGINNQGARAVAFSPAMPAYLMEAPFDTGSVKARQYCWWGWISNIGGYQIGDFDLYLFPGGWQAQLNNATSQHLEVLNTFVRSIAWQGLVPSASAITAGGSTIGASDYVSTTVNAAGTLLIAYVPPSHTGTITLDMTKLSGTSTGAWLDPTTGVRTASWSSVANTGTRVLTPPTNGLGDNDEVLVVTVP